MKKSIRKRIFSATAACLMLAAVPTMTANADWVSSSTTASAQGKSFSKKWSKDVALDINVGGDETAEASLTIGYDTWWTNEDYVTKCWAPTGWKHYAKVKNSKGSTSSTSTAKGGFNTGKADIKHTGSSVTYYAYINV